MFRDLSASLRPALVLTLAFFLLTGLVYPLAITAAAQVLFPHQANGSLVARGGAVVGSSLIAQKFAADGYFHPRPSAAGTNGYDPTASGGSNYGPTAKPLIDRIRADLKAQPGAPADLVTTSASGLDPEISPDAALWQVPRIAAARHLPAAQLDALVAAHSEKPLLGVIGEPRVNVLLLNLDLDSLATKGALRTP